MPAAEAILEGQLPTFQTTIHSKHAAYPSKSVFAMQGKHIIELGAGCGLVGLVFAAHGANVLLTDLPNVMVSLVIVPHSTKRVKDTDFQLTAKRQLHPWHCLLTYQLSYRIMRTSMSVQWWHYHACSCLYRYVTLHT